MHSITAVRRRLPRLAAAGLLASALIAGTGVAALADQSSYPGSMTTLGTRLLFVADDGSGYELWSTNGTTTAMVKEIGAGNVSANPYNLVKAGTRVFFSAYDGTNEALWRTDGTPSGTKRLRNLAQYATPVAIGSRIYLPAYTETNGIELWTSDGTSNGTKRLTDLRAGSLDGIDPFVIAPIGTRVAFSGDDADGSEDAWVAGSTTGSVKRLKDFSAGSIEWMRNVAGTLYFARLVDGTAELWTSDGTKGGTTKVWSTGARIEDPTVVGSTLFFRSFTDAAGAELWRTKGTAASTRMVKDINPGPGDSFPEQLTAVGSKLFFAASTTDFELWVSDGTKAGTKELDINPTGDSYPFNLQAVGSRLYLYAIDASHGQEPWVSDGTAAGTRMIKDVWPGDGSSSSTTFHSFGKLGTRIYFAADDSVHGYELWRTTSTGAKLWANINPN